MDHKIRVAGYVKLAKLWERNRSKAMEYHQQFYRQLFADSDYFELIGVYVDITGEKEIPNRPEMVRLLRDCMEGRIDVIATQTKAYLAANIADLCYLVKFLFDLNPSIDILTEDEEYSIDTIAYEGTQREAIQELSSQFVSETQERYTKWSARLLNKMGKLNLD